METRKLGSQGLSVPVLGLGCMGMDFQYGQADDAESRRVLDRSLDLGMNFWDTAEMYGPFANETRLGEALKGKRNQVILATKFAWKILPDGKRVGLDGSPENVKRAVEGSLRRLGTDHLDLLYQHRLDPNTPIEETVGAMADLVKEGKVKYLGLSEVGPQTIRRAHAVHPLSALQSEYSLWETGVEEKVLPTLRELGIGFVAFSPAGRGFLSGAIRKFEDLAPEDGRRTIPRFQGENFAANMRLVDQIRIIAEGKGATPTQVALAWLLTRGNDVVAIPGTTKVKHLEENALAAQLKLDQFDQAAISGILSGFRVSGERHSPAMLKTVSKD